MTQKTGIAVWKHQIKILRNQSRHHGNLVDELAGGVEQNFSAARFGGGPWKIWKSTADVLRGWRQINHTFLEVFHRSPIRIRHKRKTESYCYILVVVVVVVVPQKIFRTTNIENKINKVAK